MDRFDCYEACVQSPRHVAAFLRAAHADEPTVLREDFCGTGAISLRWIEDGRRRDERVRALGVDIDPEAIARARERGAPYAPDARFAQGDCAGDDSPFAGEGADVVFVGNFSIGYIHRRDALVHYLRCARERLDRAAGGFGGGVFVCDTYGGAGAFRLGTLNRRHVSRGREIVHYTWAHEEADPATSMVLNSISFRVEVDGEIIREFPRAFTYHWRLWSIAELRDAMHDAGFASSEVHTHVDLAPGEKPIPVTDPRGLGEDWVVLVVGRTRR